MSSDAEQVIQIIVQFCYDFLNPYTPMSDQDRSSPYNMNTISSRQLMVIRKIDIKEIDFFSIAFTMMVQNA